MVVELKNKDRSESLQSVIDSNDASFNFGIKNWCYKFIGLSSASLCLSVGSKLVIDPLISVDIIIQQLGNLYFATALATWYASTRLLKVVIEKTAAALQSNRGKNMDAAVMRFGRVFLDLKSVSSSLTNSSSLALCYIMVSSFGVSLLFGTMAALNIATDKHNMQAFFPSLCISLMGLASIYFICICGNGVEKQLHRGCQIALIELKTMRCKRKTKIMMSKYFSHFMNQMPALSFNGYMPVNKQLFATLFSAFIGNLILLLQSRKDLGGISDTSNYNATDFITYGKRFV